MEKITIKNVSNGYIVEVESEQDYGYAIEHDTKTFVESNEDALKSRLGEIVMKEYSHKNYYTDGSVINITIE